MNKNQYEFNQFENKSEPYEKEIETIKIDNGVVLRNKIKKVFRKILEPFDSYKVEPALHNPLANTQTIDGMIKPIEHLTPMQRRNAMVSNFRNFQDNEKSQRNLGRIIQTVLFLLALFGFVELIIWII